MSIMYAYNDLVSKRFALSFGRYYFLYCIFEIEIFGTLESYNKRTMEAAGKE